MSEYVSPKISFDRLELFEKIANPCWAGNTAVSINDLMEIPVDATPEWSIPIPKYVTDPDCGDDEMEYFITKVKETITDTNKLNKFLDYHKSSFKTNTKIGDWSCKS